MPKRIAHCLGLWTIFFYASGIFAQDPAAPVLDDNQMWGELQLSVPLQTNTSLLVNGALRGGRDISHFVYERAGVALSFRLNNSFSVSSGYSFVASQPFESVDTREQRCSLSGSISLPLKSFTLTDRNLIERRFREPVDSTRYRNSVQLARPIKLGDVRLLLFVSDEVAYDWSVNAWVRNRFSVGGGKNLTDKLSLDIFYLRQNGSHIRPRDLQAIGTVLRVKF